METRLDVSMVVSRSAALSDFTERCSRTCARSSHGALAEVVGFDRSESIDEVEADGIERWVEALQVEAGAGSAVAAVWQRRCGRR